MGYYGEENRGNGRGIVEGELQRAKVERRRGTKLRDILIAKGGRLRHLYGGFLGELTTLPGGRFVRDSLCGETV
jgi:hypothetical protein